MSSHQRMIVLKISCLTLTVFVFACAPKSREYAWKHLHIWKEKATLDRLTTITRIRVCNRVFYLENDFWLKIVDEKNHVSLDRESQEITQSKLKPLPKCRSIKRRLTCKQKQINDKTKQSCAFADQSWTVWIDDKSPDFGLLNAMYQAELITSELYCYSKINKLNFLKVHQVIQVNKEKKEHIELEKMSLKTIDNKLCKKGLLSEVPFAKNTL